MRKLKTIMCLLLALTIFMGSTITSHASEESENPSDYVQDLTTFEKNLRVYFNPMQEFCTYGDVSPDNTVMKYSVKRLKTSETVYMGFFRDLRSDLDYKYCQLVVISDKPNVKYSVYSINCKDDEDLQEALQHEIVPSGNLGATVVIDDKTYYYTVFSMGLHGNDNINTALWVFPEGTGSGSPKKWQELFGSDDVPAEWEDGVKPLPERDEDFQFVDFKSDEWVRASWSGTTYDDKAGDYDSITYEVRLSYARVGGRPDDIQEEEVLTRDGIISSGTWSKKYSLLTHENDGLYLRYAKFTPLAHKGGFTCRGKTEIQSFTEDGSDDPREDKLTYKQVDDFYLKGLTVDYSDLLYTSTVTWTGTTYDHLICNVPLDKTHLTIQACCYDNNMDIVWVDVEDILWDGEIQRLRYSIDDAWNRISFDNLKIHDYANAHGLVWNGKVYMKPVFFYEPHNCIYQGATQVIDLTGGKIEVNPEPAPMPLPSPTPDDGTDDDDGGDDDDGFLPDDDDLTPDNALEWVWKVLRNLYKQLGQFPQLMYNLFPYIPVEIYHILGIMLLLVILLRILGR